MGRRRTARGVKLGVVLAALASLVAPATASAALLWTLTASPLSVLTGTPTVFTLTASNLLLGRIECVVVDVPANFSITAVGIVGSTAGDSWLARREGNEVTVWTTSGGDRLELLDSVTFTVDATAVAVGSLAWPANAYDRQDCGGSGSVLSVPPVVLVTGPTVTPSPSPTPTPTPTSTPTPSPTPLVALPSLPLPTVALPTLSPSTPPPDPTSSPGPTLAPSGSPGSASVAPASALPGENANGGPPSGAVTSVAAPGEVPAAGPVPAVPRIAFDEPELGLDIASLGVLGGVGVWAVPAATIAGPGLFVLLWVALQAGGMSVLVPAVRRLRGEDATPARSSRPEVT